MIPTDTKQAKALIDSWTLYLKLILVFQRAGNLLGSGSV